MKYRHFVKKLVIKHAMQGRNSINRAIFTALKAPRNILPCSPSPKFLKYLYAPLENFHIWPCFEPQNTGALVSTR